MATKNEAPLDPQNTPTEQRRSSKSTVYVLAILVLIIAVIAVYSFWQ